MKTRSLKTTTAIVASLALVVPAPAFSQEPAAGAPETICPEGAETPCPEADAGEDVAEEPDGEIEDEPEAEALEIPIEENGTSTESGAVEAELPSEPDDGEEGAETEVQTDPEPAAESDAEPELDVDAAAEQEAAEAEADPEPDASLETEAETTADTDTAPAEDTGSETDAEIVEESDTETETDLELSPDATAEDDANTDTTEEVDTAVETDSDTDAQTGATEETQVEAESDPETSAEVDAEEELIIEDEAPATAAAAAVDEGVDAETTAEEVVTDTVTEENTRSSDEDFETGVIEDSRAASSADTDDDSDDLENILLLGLGALAVGAILNNGSEVVSNSGDRVVVRQGETYRVLKDDDALLRQPGVTTRTATYGDGSTRTILTRPNGTEIVTIRDARGRVLRRTRIEPDGTEYLLFDDTQTSDPVDLTQLRQSSRDRVIYDVSNTDGDALRAALETEADLDRRFSLRQVRDIREVRELMPQFDLDAINFATGSAAITPDQARDLRELGLLLEDYITENPREIFLVEGHTDAVGGWTYNLALSDRRAESVALALTEYFDVPPENLVVQGYGEEFLKVQTDGPSATNRRATVRRITPLLRSAAANQ